MMRPHTHDDESGLWPDCDSSSVDRAGAGSHSRGAQSHTARAERKVRTDVMKTLVARLCVVTGLAVGAAGCSVGYIYERYGASGPAIVTVGCHTSYEVWESYRDRTLLVRTNPQ